MRYGRKQTTAAHFASSRAIDFRRPSHAFKYAWASPLPSTLSFPLTVVNPVSTIQARVHTNTNQFVVEWYVHSLATGAHGDVVTDVPHPSETQSETLSGG